ncbi:MAG: glycosyltransferase, partial [bacterium]
IYIEENNNLKSPYSSRNRGIELAKGEILVFLDATCRPSNNWLLEGIKLLYNQKADIVAGEVKFDFQGNVTNSKIYDAITNINMKRSVTENNVAKTANLFVKREVFKTIGLFPESVRSGADVRWTRMATNNKLKLVFAENAIVYKIARGFTELIKKQKRVALYQPQIWYDQDKKILLRRYLSLKKMLPPSPKNIKKKIKEFNYEVYRPNYFKLLIIGFIINNIMRLFNIIGIRKIVKHSNFIVFF